MRICCAAAEEWRTFFALSFDVESVFVGWRRLVTRPPNKSHERMEQMDKDWDDYYDKVDEYKAKTGIDPEKEQSTVSKQIDSKKEDKTS